MSQQPQPEPENEPAADESQRKPASERRDSFDLAAWLLEGATGLFEEARHRDLGLSPAFWQHAKAARRETLLALRAVLDELIEKSERQDQAEAERQQRHQRRGSIKISS